jgi:glutaminyl-peptide cyclotransferase
MKIFFNIIIILASFIFISCGKKDVNKQLAEPQEIQAKTTTHTRMPPSFSWELLETIPHDVTAYTQGLVYHNDYLYESTGHYGHSTIRKINPETGQILKKESIPDAYFGEGITIFEDKIYMLTWESRQCLIINLETFKIENTFSYRGEGWGLTHDDKHLIMSDGTNLLRFIDPAMRQVVKTLPVSYNSRPVSQLNELEYIEGKIWANLYGEDRIAIIDPVTGAIENVIDFSELRKFEKSNPHAEVFNGIAYDKNKKYIYLTGKNWSGFSRIKIN